MGGFRLAGSRFRVSPLGVPSLDCMRKRFSGFCRFYGFKGVGAAQKIMKRREFLKCRLPFIQTLYALAKQQTTSNALLSNLRLESANSHDLGNMFSPYRHSERSRGIFVIFLRRTADTILLHETRLAAYSENTAFPISLSTHSSHLPPTKKIPPLRPPDDTRDTLSPDSM